MMKISEVLTDARKLIERPENWCRGTMARDSDGCAVPVEHKLASKFCSTGAVNRVAHSLENSYARGVDALNMLYKVMSRVYGNASPVPTPFPFSAPVSIAAYNDMQDRTHYEILKLFDDAIALAKKEEV